MIRSVVVQQRWNLGQTSLISGGFGRKTGALLDGRSGLKFGLDVVYSADVLVARLFSRWDCDRVWGSFAHQSCRTIVFLSVRFRGWLAVWLARGFLDRPRGLAFTRVSFGEILDVAFGCAGFF